jgi:hypothetical protein
VEQNNISITPKQTHEIVVWKLQTVAEAVQLYLEDLKIQMI